MSSFPCCRIQICPCCWYEHLGVPPQLRNYSAMLRRFYREIVGLVELLAGRVRGISAAVRLAHPGVPCDISSPLVRTDIERVCCHPVHAVMHVVPVVRTEATYYVGFFTTWAIGEPSERGADGYCRCNVHLSVVHT